MTDIIQIYKGEAHMKLKFVKNEKKLYEFDSEKVIWIQTRNKGTDVCLFQQAVKWIPFPLAEVRE